MSKLWNFSLLLHVDAPPCCRADQQVAGMNSLDKETNQSPQEGDLLLLKRTNKLKGEKLPHNKLLVAVVAKVFLT